MDSNELQFIKALSFYREGRIEDCVRELSLIFARTPDYGRANWLQASILHLYLRDFAKAEEQFKLAMRTAPDYGEVYLGYAALLLDLGRYTELVAILNKASEVPGIEMDLVDRLFGQLYERQEKWEDAMRHYSKAQRYTYSKDRMLQLQEDLDRCLKKQGL